MCTSEVLRRTSQKHSHINAAWGAAANVTRRQHHTLLDAPTCILPCLSSSNTSVHVQQQPQQQQQQPQPQQPQPQQPQQQQPQQPQ